MNVRADLHAAANRHVSLAQRVAIFLLLLFASLASWPSVASAQTLSRVGNSQGVLNWGGTVRGTDVAYDPAHDIYLVVAANGPMRGVFTDATGAIAAGTASFPIGSATGDPNYAQFPRVRFSADVNNGQGGFLVTWHQNDGKPNHVHAAVVAYPTGTITADAIISDDQQGGSWWEAGAPVAYSATSKKFLVAWQSLANGLIFGRFVSTAGQPVGGIMTFESSCSRDPGLTWNPATDEFGLSETAYCNGTSAGAFAAFRRIAASSGALSARTTWGYSAGTFITDITENPSTNHYVIGWANAAANNYAEVDQTGTLLATGLLNVGTYDSLGLGFNSVSGTILAVGQGNGAEVFGRELSGAGVPMSDVVTLTNGGGVTGSFYPRTTARSGNKQWNIVYSRQFAAATDQIVATSSGQGSSTRIVVDSPAGGTAFNSNSTFAVSGWTVDSGAPSGTGIDAVHVYVFPAGSNSGVFLGATTTFTPRSDVSGLLGAQFVNSGYSVTVNLSGMAAGNYTLNVYPHSMISGQFGAPKSVTITVGGGQPLMSLDSPTNGTNIGGTFNIGGWAIDRSAPSGTGVDAVHVYAFPPNNAAGIFLGAAALGNPRNDVGAAYGGQFTNAGYNLTASLPTGTYTVVAYLHSSVTNSFSLSKSANITVGGSQPAMSIDSPAAGSTQPGVFSVGGWAIDRGAPSGTGVDVVLLLAFPQGTTSAVFVGVGTPFARPDIGALFGGQFTNSGFNVPVSGLAPGSYDLGVYAHSTVTGTFNQVQFIRVTVQ